jgi:hypothetical protein
MADMAYVASRLHLRTVIAIAITSRSRDVLKSTRKLGLGTMDGAAIDDD